MRIHSDWAAPGFALQSLSAHVGPFATSAMLRCWWEQRGSGALLIVEADESLLPFYRFENTIRFMGEADLFDYHSPLGADAVRLVAEWAEDLESDLILDFDSLPGDAADALMTGLNKAGLVPVAEVHQSAAVLTLPDDYEGYLAQLDKKQRHETRRKRRRFTEILGEPSLMRATGQDAITRFAAMHRKAAGDKGTFMNEDMEEYFQRLHIEAAGHVDFLHGDRDVPVAAAFGFEDEDTYYLYNSAYDPDEGAASPGIVLVSELIDRTIADGGSRFDFLKGDETYKYRLGAQARPLWRVSAKTGERP